MTLSQPDKPQSDLPALLCQLQQLTDKIRQQVEQQLAGMQEAQPSESQQSQPICDTLKKHQEIYSLAQQGLEPLEIVRQTGKTLGEVQVILALRKSE